MKRMKAALTLILVLFGVMASAPALAWHHGRVHIGVFVGGPVFSPWYYGSYYNPYYGPYYYPPAVPASPPVYIEQGDPQAAPAPSAAPRSQGYWYFCADSKTYYPYVKECPGGWQRVTPQPASGG